MNDDAGMCFAECALLKTIKTAQEDSKMKFQGNIKRLETTVGDLVVALVDAALKGGRSQTNAYRMTGAIVNTLLQPAPARVPPRLIRSNMRRFRTRGMCSRD
jgi:hypothetical protein